MDDTKQYPSAPASFPAFPNRLGYRGLTKREYFAAQMMKMSDNSSDQERYARMAVESADALIKELSK